MAAAGFVLSRFVNHLYEVYLCLGGLVGKSMIVIYDSLSASSNVCRVFPGYVTIRFTPMKQQTFLILRPENWYFSHQNYWHIDIYYTYVHICCN